MTQEPAKSAAQSSVSPATVSVTTPRGQLPPAHMLRLFLQWGVPALVLLVLGNVVAQRLSLVELHRILERAQPEWLFLGMLIYGSTNLWRALRMVQLLGWPGSRAPSMVPIMFALSLFNNLLPMRTGELSFPYLMQREGIAYGPSLAVLLVSRLLDLLAVCALFLLAAAGRYTSLSGPAKALVLAAAVLLFLLIVLIACLPILGPRTLRALIAWLDRTDSQAHRWRARASTELKKASTALEFLHPGHKYWPALLISLTIWLSTYAWFAAFLRGVGLPTDLSKTILGASLAALGKSLPIGTIGGFGAHEAGWTLGFTMIGEPLETAILGGVAVNVLTLLSSALFGTAGLVWLARRSGRSWRSYLPGARERATAVEQAGHRPIRPWRKHAALFLILTAFMSLGVVYSTVTPLFETPDEIWHYLYVKHVADGGGLPEYREGVEFAMRQEASQPPLYYLLNGWATAWIGPQDADEIVRYNPHAAIGAPSAYGNRNVTAHTPMERFPYQGTTLAAHFSRLLSVVLGAGTVICTYAIAGRLFPGTPWLAPAAAAFNAFLPQFVFIQASTNNDVLVTLLAAMCLWLLVCIAQDGPSATRLLALGAVLGLGALSKLNGLVLLPLTAIALGALAWKRRRPLAAAGWGALIFCAASVTGGWWYVRNWKLYGDPLGLQLMFAVLPQRAVRPSLPELMDLMDGALKSFFGVFGWFNIVMEPGLYQVFLVCLILAAVGLARIAYLGLRHKKWADLRRLALLTFWSLTFVAALVTWTQARYPQGRLLFPALPAISILLVLGLAQWFPARRRRIAIAGLLVTLCFLAALVPFRYIGPAYAPKPTLSDKERTAIANPLSARLGESILLVGYELDETRVKRGERLWLTLYWEGRAVMDRDYSVFVHLIDEHGVTLAQRDSYPGAGNNPTRGWRPGLVLSDVHPLDVPAGFLSQGPFHVRVGMYDYATQERLPVWGADGSGGNYVALPADLTLEDQSTASLIELDLDFEGVISLTSYSVEPIPAQPGDTLRITLYWRALRGPRDDYTVFSQLLRQGDQIWGQNDHGLRDGEAPTSAWNSGRVVVDAFELTIPADAPEDVYDLTVGLYDPTTMIRPKLADGTDFVVLGRIAVRQH